jgi:hypothetical protein
MSIQSALFSVRTQCHRLLVCVSARSDARFNCETQWLSSIRVAVVDKTEVITHEDKTDIG